MPAADLSTVARLIYCAAFVLEDGESVGDVMPEQMRAAITELSTVRPDRAIPMPVKLRRPVHRELRATFLAFAQDKTMPPGVWHPGMSGRLNGAAVIEIDGDHQMPLTAPGLLSDALHHAAITPG
jgi:hypothetical protein